MRRIFILIETIFKLGIINCFNAKRHGLYKKYNFYKFNNKYKKIDPPIFRSFKINKVDFSNKKKLLIYDQKCIEEANLITNGKLKLFSKNIIDFGEKPNWHFDYVLNKEIESKYNHWSKIDFFGDIDVKRVWELSRWNWAPLLARAWIISNDKRYIKSLNNLIISWCHENKFNQGINWADGQEASIRLIHAFLTFKIIDQIRIPNYSKSRSEFIKLHLNRLKQTYFYEKSQQNNHWISIASGMIIGGGWIYLKSTADKKLGKLYFELGVKELEKGVKNLVLNDGSFSQYSTNYHRLVLDTLSQVEIFRRDINLNLFSNNFYKNCIKLTKWYLDFIDINSGNISNIGHNDGALCYQLISKDYRDCRSTAFISANIFLNRNILLPDSYKSLYYWLGIKRNKKFFKFNYPSLKLYKDGGYGVLKPNQDYFGILKFPVYKFRPSQADVLHFDLWSKGKNILRDAGTFSYNTSKETMDYFFGVESHNTIQFDNYQPMKKISRFLYGNWLKAKNISYKIIKRKKLEICASYSFKNGYHKRTITTKNKGQEWIILDEISAYKNSVILRWRLIKSNWKLSKNRLESNFANIIISSNKEIGSIKLEDGWESQFYDNKRSLQVVRVEFKEKVSKIKTVIHLK